MSLLIKVDGQSKTPIFRQIMDQIIGLVDGEALKPGAQLPSTRAMADRLGVNRSTVYRAYQELWSLGYVESSPGSYSTIRKRTRVFSREEPLANGLIDWSSRINDRSEKLYKTYLLDQARFKRPGIDEVINFIPLSPDSRLLPLDSFRKCMNKVLIKEGVGLLQYGCPAGYGPLRKFIADRMRQHSVSISADEILITTGAQNAIELLMKLLTEPGDGVVMESPTYTRAIDVFRFSRVRMLEVPMNKGGMDLDALEGLLDRESPALVYTIPNFHNPTGITTEQSHRERLLLLCQRHGLPLVEDGFEEEMKYFGKAVLPIKSMDRRKVVIYLGTFSKILFPGLRIGWVAADRACIERLAAIQRSSILSGNLLDQAALDSFCRAGYYDHHVNRMHRIYRKRMQTAFKAMKTHLNSGRVEWTQPSGGYTIWIRLKDMDVNEDEILNIFFRHGVTMQAGGSHYLGPSTGPCFRLSIAHLDETEVEEGIRRLARGLDELYQGRQI